MLETRYAIDYDKVKIVQLLVVLAMASHWFACAWGLQATFHDSPEKTWMGELGYCTPVPPTNSSTRVEYACMPPFAIYSASFYWAAMTLTSIGYGDIAATQGNSSEQVPPHNAAAAASAPRSSLPQLSEQSTSSCHSVSDQSRVATCRIWPSWTARQVRSHHPDTCCAFVCCS